MDLLSEMSLEKRRGLAQIALLELAYETSLRPDIWPPEDAVKNVTQWQKDYKRLYGVEETED